MKKKLFMAFIILIPILLSGCATTSIASLKNPKYSEGTHNQYKRLLIACDTQDIKEMKAIEDSFKKEFNKNGVFVVLQNEVIPPFNSRTKETVDKYLLDNTIDGILIIQLAGYKKDIKYDPGDSYSTSQVFFNGGIAHVDTQTHSYSGGIHTYDNYKHQVSLVDSKTRDTVWVATADTQETYNFHGIINPNLFMVFAQKVYKQMVQENLLVNGVSMK